MFSLQLNKSLQSLKRLSQRLHPNIKWKTDKPPPKEDIIIDLEKICRTKDYLHDESCGPITRIDQLVETIVQDDEKAAKKKGKPTEKSASPSKIEDIPEKHGDRPPLPLPTSPRAPSKKPPDVPKIKIYKIFRWQPGQKAELKSYQVDLRHCGPSQLDALFYVKNKIDGTLSFRRSCREGTCGVCAVNIDGINRLPCIRKVDRNLAKPTIIYPLPHMYVIRDLVVDFTRFYEQYKYIQPWLQRKQEICELGKAPYMQATGDRAKLDGLWECHLCGCCTFSCPTYWHHSDKFLGPSALLNLYRWLIDSRDEMTEERLKRLRRDADKVFKCNNIMNCTNCCPKKLKPNIYINKIKRMLAGFIEKEPPIMVPNALHRAGFDATNLKTFEVPGSSIEKAMAEKSMAEPTPKKPTLSKEK